MRNKSLLILLYFFCFIGVIKSAPNLEVKGSNFEIATLKQSAQIFQNRTGMFFGAIPAEFQDWKFTYINANSSYMAGPLPSIQVRSATNGDVYVMVSNIEKPAICAQWASDNGWTLVSGFNISYGSNDWEKFAFYKKTIVANTWVSITQPNVFSGAVLIAPDLTLEGTQPIQAAPVTIESYGAMTTDVLKSGVLAYNNRTYVYGTIPTAISGQKFTRYNGGAAPTLKVTANADGELYIGVSSEDIYFDVSSWTKIEGISFGYNDPSNTTFTLYKKAVSNNQILDIYTTAWQGILIIAPEIQYTVINDFTPPPGVVIHNSKANTKKFIGSPSIVVLDDGTYLASHDYFGTRTETFVYRSDDKGLTWSQTANILDLKWATIFNRGTEVYLIGVRVDGTEYGNTVILKSVNAGVSWTNPTNNTNGLLLSGYYHCAPVPIVKHNGKLWRAMEDQGEPNGWGKFKSFMMSIDENADLLKAANWTVSNKLTFDAGSNNYGSAWLEGNAVVAKDGSVKNVLRVHYGGDDKAAIIDVSADGTVSSFNSQTGFVTFPGASKKFTIRYDDVSDKYWTMSNYVLEESRLQSSNNERIRNTVVLSWSDDLITWHIKDTILHHPNVSNHGFQYQDWLFDGDDIIAVSRTAWEDETGAADSQHNANYITFHRFKNFRYQRADVEETVLVKKWFNGAESALALTFDDGFKAHYDYAYPILKTNGLKATFFINSGNLVNEGQTKVGRYGVWKDFKKMAKDGHEIASHSLSHANLSTATYLNLLNELKIDKQNIETNIGQDVYTLAYPYCLHNTTVDNVASSLFIAGRQCGGIGNNNSLKGAEWFSVNSDLLTWTTPRSIANDEVSATSLKSALEFDIIPNNKFGVLCIHEVVPFSLLSSTDSYEPATVEWLTNISEYLKIKQTSGEIWTTTFANIVRYAQERDNLRILKNELDNGNIEYKFSDWLNDSIFNVPVTVEIDLPLKWAKIKCSIIEDGVTVSESEHQDTDSKVVLNIIPDKHSVLFSNAGGSSLELSKEDIFYTIYPNPVTDLLNVSGNSNFDGVSELYDLQGKLIRRVASNTAVGSSFSIDMSSFSSGMYLLKIKDKSGKSAEFKVIKK